MISCKHSRQLFDRYLDGELSPSLQAELHAHQIACGHCQSELAMMEACGDVIRHDCREPRLSDSFTDRVMAAHHERQVIRARRWFIPQGPWYRAATIVLSPLAAAASIALAVSLILPTYQPAPPTVVAGDGGRQAIPKDYQEIIGVDKSDVTPEAQQALASTPQMSAVHFMDALVKPVVEQAQTTIDGARSSTAWFELLVQKRLSRPTDKLVAEWRLQEDSGPEGSNDPAYSPLDPLDPSQLNRAAPAETNEPVLEAF